MSLPFIPQSYIEGLQKQKELISELGNSGSSVPGIPGVKSVIDRLAALDESFKKVKEYYEDAAEKEADKEEQNAVDSGIVETDEQKRARREAKRREAVEKIDEEIGKYAEKQESFVREQLAIIEVNYNFIIQQIKDLPNAITLALTTSLQPAAVGAAVPNPFYNIGILFQNLSTIKSSISSLKNNFLQMLIAADKIKLALPDEVTGLLQTILKIQDGISLPKREKFDQPPPPVPSGTVIELNLGDYRQISGPGNYAVVTSEGILGTPKGTTGQIVEFVKENNILKKIRLKVGPIVQNP